MAHNQIDYIELVSSDLAATEAFYSKAFGWEFTHHGPAYISFYDGRMRGGFARGVPEHGGPAVAGPAHTTLLVLYTSDLEAAEEKVVAAGGVLSKTIYSFPGGRRFHFTDPSGNELAVWSE